MKFPNSRKAKTDDTGNFLSNIVAITHFRIHSSPLPLQDEGCPAYHSGNLPQLQAQGSATFLVLCAHRYHLQQGRDRGAQGSSSHQPV